VRPRYRTCTTPSMQHTNNTCIHVHHRMLLPAGSSKSADSDDQAEVSQRHVLATDLTFRLDVTVKVRAWPCPCTHATAYGDTQMEHGAASTHPCMHPARADLHGRYRGCQSALHVWLPRTSWVWSSALARDDCMPCAWWRLRLLVSRFLRCSGGI
jgi:hypothetical protein